MRRSLSNKLIFAVLAAVILPFLVFAVFIDSQIASRLKNNVVRQSLQSLATDLAHEIDRTVAECNAELDILAADFLGESAIDEAALARSPEEWTPELLRSWELGQEPSEPWPEASVWRRTATDVLDRYIRNARVYDLIVLVGADGRLVTASGINANGEVWSADRLESFFEHDYANEPWFGQALEVPVQVDHHVSPLPVQLVERDDAGLAYYHVGFATPVRRYLGDEVVGVIYALVNWSHFYEVVSVPEVKAYFSGLVQDAEPSPYAWIWKDDGDTILGHVKPSLIYERVTGPLVHLPQMKEDALSAPSGLYREYSFGGVVKNAAFQHCRGPNPDAPLEAGLGWIVGVGIDNSDINAMAGELRDLLYKSTAAILLVAVLWILFVARRMTEPIRALQQHTRQVASGNLDAQIDVKSRDELGELAVDFNTMTRDLRENRAQLVKAEKDAAWREMARQIAHDIKGPLTPIKLSVDLVKRARRERSPEYERILEKTLDLVESQVENLRGIATDFYEFTGGRKPTPERFSLGEQLGEVLELNRAWADELGVAIGGKSELGAVTTQVHADRMKLQRVLTNLVANAFQAMPEGGSLDVAAGVRAGRVELDLCDTGVGLSEEVREHLFEPYFTTRSEGTGLGLAIAKRVLEEFGGGIELAPNAGPKGGTCVRMWLPEAPQESGEPSAAGGAETGA